MARRPLPDGASGPEPSTGSGADASRTVAVAGATGRQGGAVARALVAAGWRVRGLTRHPTRRPARALAALGVEITRADMDDPASLVRALHGAHGVYSVQNFMISGIDGEVRQGRNVAEAARRAGVRHLVYASAGTGERGTGIGSWESKLDVEQRLRELELPVTVLRPTAFMELMTDPAFHPAVGTWHVWPKLAGGSFEVPWLCCHDLGVIAERVFADPGRFIGQDLMLAADRRSLDECRRIYTRVCGRPPRRWPMPVWMLERFAADTVALWRWTRATGFDADLRVARSIHPAALDVEEWLARQAGATTTR
ncbi:NmrA/HSCARG family protein [Pseudonocardia sp. C8]|uniref:NmrA/HSCARG family protein n=1 Tax=Pseudonocardia sp. C8 TaxID=2762759 RepID=UPI0016423780|nr:NmrA/HSCARG family protein [Pseudonocardia sp. C8]